MTTLILIGGVFLLGVGVGAWAERRISNKWLDDERRRSRGLQATCDHLGREVEALRDATCPGCARPLAVCDAEPKGSHRILWACHERRKIARLERVRRRLFRVEGKTAS